MGVLDGGMNPGRSRPETALFHGLERNAAGKTQARDGLLDRPGIDAGVHQGAKGHVPRNATEAVEIADTHSQAPSPGGQNGETRIILTGLVVLAKAE